MEQKPKVYFTKEISPQKVVEMFKKLNIKLPWECRNQSSFWRKRQQKFYKT